MNEETLQPRSPNLWQRFLLWLDDKEDQEVAPPPPSQPAPRFSSDTEVPLSKTQKIRLQSAVDPANANDTRLYKRGY